jgi:hypothetical protein
VTYIVRNTIVLGAVLLVIALIGGYFTILSLPKEIKQLDEKIKKNSSMAQKGPELLDTYNTLFAQYNDMNERWLSRSKVIPAKDITGETYEYIVQIIEQCGDIKLQNVTYNGQKEMSKGKYGYGEYTLVGVSNFGNIFKFIWYLENGRRLMKINELRLTGNEVLDSMGTRVDVQFTMKLHSYYSSVKELNTAPNPVPYELPVVTANPFRPWLSSAPRMIRAGEIDIRSSFLKGVIAGKAFIIDQNGKLRTLEEGDQVYLGSVTNIIPEEGKIECTLDEGGIQSTFELYVPSSGQAIQ